MPDPRPTPNGINKMIKSFEKVLLCMLKYVPGVQEACNEEVRDDPHSLAFIPDFFKTQGMCNEAVRRKP